MKYLKLFENFETESKDLKKKINQKEREIEKIKLTRKGFEKTTKYKVDIGKLEKELKELKKSK